MKKIMFAFLLFLTGVPLKAQDDYLELEKHVYRSIPYRLLKPEGENSNQKYPLVLFLHGSGERGKDNVINLLYIAPLFMKGESRTRFPCYLLVPQCPPDAEWQDNRNGSGPADVVMTLLDSLSSSLRIDTRRIYVTGLSMGGYGTWYLLGKYPGKFAAAAPVCGGGDPGKATLFKSTPLWIFHGTDDEVVPVNESRKMVKAVADAGGKPKYSEYAGVGHNCWNKAYGEPEFLSWLFDHKLKL